MFFQIIKIIKYHKPKYLFLENVPNLLNHNNGETWNFMKKQIENLNYDVDQKILSPLILKFHRQEIDFTLLQSKISLIVLVAKNIKLNQT